MNEKQLKILVVDDDHFVRLMLTNLLEASGYSAITAVNGVDALKKHTGNKDLDLIISDMNMDEMNGLELIRALREINENMPFIILTVNNEISVALEAIRCGADDYLLKDENIQETLLLSIENVMEKYRLKLENMRLIEDLARKNKELERLSFLDPLTDISNRRYFDKVIDQELKRSTREGGWIGLIIIDIDFFKSYNDTYGHQQGDKCLQKVAKSLQRSLKRPGDFVARYGGEEFVIVLPGADMKGAANVAETVRENIEKMKILHESAGSEKIVTVSLGVSAMIPEYKTEPAELISLADQALYLSKANGRNRVEIITPKNQGADS